MAQRTNSRVHSSSALRNWKRESCKFAPALQDSRFQFRSALLECTREFARRAMADGITKRSRAKQIERMRSVVTSHYLQMQNKEWSYICFVELSCVPVRPSEAAYHVYSQKGGAQMKWQARCIIPNPLQYALYAPETSQALCSFVSRLLESNAGRFFIKHVPQNFSMPKEMR